MRLYFKYFAIQLKCAMQHKGSLCMLLLAQIFTSCAGLLSIYWLFDRFGSVQGFDFEEILICYSVVLMGFSLAETFARGFDHFPQLISNGKFDRMLVRPRGAVFQVLASTIEFTRLGRLLQAAAVFAYALPNCGIEWSFDKCALLALMVICAAALFGALFWLQAGIAFFTTESLEVINVFTDSGREHGAYPISVYGKEVLNILTYVVPLACVQYYPLMYLTGRWQDPRLFFTPLAAFAFMLPTALVWRIGLRHYRSTGS